jgi:hypothetical protein
MKSFTIFALIASVIAISHCYKVSSPKQVKYYASSAEAVYEEPAAEHELSSSYEGTAEGSEDYQSGGHEEYKIIHSGGGHGGHGGMMHLSNNIMSLYHSIL